MKNQQFSIWYIIAIILISSSIVISNETIIITNVQSQLSFNDIVFLILSSITLFASFLYILLIRKRVKLFNSYFFIFAFIYIAINAIAVALTEIPITFTTTDRFGVNYLLTYPITNFEIYQSIYFNVSTVILTYLLIIILPQIFSRRTYLLSIYYLLISTLLVLIIYSLITEWEAYITLYLNGIRGRPSTTSLFSDPNVFGFFLTLGVLGTGLVETLRHRWWNYLLILIFIFALITTYCFTGYVVSSIFLLSFFGYDLYKMAQKRTFFSYSVLVISTLIICSLIIFLAISKAEFASIFREQIIPNSLINFNTRLTIWRHATEILHGIYIIIGRGVSISNSLLETSLSVENQIFISPNRFHNGFFDILASGGLLLVFLYLIIYLLLFKRIFTIIHFNRKYGITMLFILIGYLLYTIPEAKVLFKGDSMGGLATLLVVTPLVIDKRLYAKHLRRL
jgi:O-antigen ligase